MICIEKIPPTNLNWIKSKNHNDNCEKSNHNINNRISNKEWKLDNLEGFD